ncbi:Momilactone A synthase [Senna tora]|uniref:Momilactone A synthase n=1 Tax=Senna tora TaxID=362788 RepID=A0A834W069_9FABA|nr:Momilactone A synthase [Senna tora]
MPRQIGSMDLIPGKIRKRGCSSSASSTSSVLQNYRFKRAILVRKRGGSSTPVPTWKLMNSRSPASTLRALESPKYPPSQTGSKAKQAPVSARKLAATLWEMNEIPSPSVKQGSDDRRLKKELRAREKLARSMHSGSLPPHLSDPSHSPVSERMDRSGTGSRHRRTPSISQRLRLTDHQVGPLDSLSNASLMEIETRSRAQTPTSSTIGVKTRLKDVSNALTTSKELLKIINRMWGHEDRPSSSMSLISALHTELERARLQVNQLIQEQRSDHNEINYLMKCFAEEKAAWKSKEQEIVEAAIESVAGELDVERKLRRRFESLNKKLGRELAETKASLLKVVKELESEKRAREIFEQVCDELARDVEDKSELDKLKRDSAKVCEEVEKEKEIMQLADMLREERAQAKLSEAKYQLEEKNAAVDKLRNQLEAFMGNKQVREKGRSSIHLNDEEIAAYLGKSRFNSHHNEDKEDDGGEVDNGVECKEDSAESDMHSIELNMDNYKSHKWTYPPESRYDNRRYPIEEEVRGRRSTSGKASRRSTSLQRSVSDGLEWGVQAEKLQNLGDGIDWESFSELEKQSQGKGYGDEIQVQGSKYVKGLRDQILAGSRLASSRVYSSPTRQFAQPWPSRDPTNTFQERPPLAQGNGVKSRLSEVRGENQNVRKSKR